MDDAAEEGEEGDRRGRGGQGGVPGGVPVTVAVAVVILPPVAVVESIPDLEGDIEAALWRLAKADGIGCVLFWANAPAPPPREGDALSACSGKMVGRAGGFGKEEGAAGEDEEGKEDGGAGGGCKNEELTAGSSCVPRVRALGAGEG